MNNSPAGYDGYCGTPATPEPSEELEVMCERDWPVYAVLMKHGDLYYHEPALGNRYNTGSGWLMVLPWAEPLKRGGIAHGGLRRDVQRQ